MLLYLIRHASASARDPGTWPEDRQRPLTPRGERRFRRAARGLHTIVGKPDAVLSSRYVRAWRTAEVLHEEADWPAPVACPELEEGHAPVAALDAAFREAGRGGRSMALVGHEPLLSKLAALLVTGQTNGASFVFKKGAVACIEYPDRPSQPSNLEPGAARMLWLAQPRLLRALAR